MKRLNLCSILLVSIFLFSCSNGGNDSPNVSEEEIEETEEVEEVEEETEEEETEEETEEEETISSTYEIATWKNFTEAAISHTWDDGSAKQLTVAMPMYDNYDFKMTLFTVTNWISNWSALKEAALNGHDVASHSLTHDRFDDIEESQIDSELKDSQIMINEQMENTNCVSFAYSNCVTESFGLTDNYYIAARSCSGQVVPSTPSNFMNISSFVCGSESSNTTAANFNSLAESAVSSNGWSVYLFHGIDSDGGWSPVDSSELGSHLEFLDNNRAVYWVDSFTNVVKYIKERDAVTDNELTTTDTQITVEFTDNLDDEIYNYPISVKKQIYTSWENIEVKQDGNTVDFEVKVEDSKQYVIFNIIPDNGVVEINKI